MTSKRKKEIHKICRSAKNILHVMGKLKDDGKVQRNARLVGMENCPGKR